MALWLMFLLGFFVSIFVSAAGTEGFKFFQFIGRCIVLVAIGTLVYLVALPIVAAF